MSGKYIVQLDEAPNVPGLIFRLYNGPQDLAAILAVREGCIEHDGVDRLSAREEPPTLEGLQRNYADTQPGYENLLLAEINGQVIGYNQVIWWTENDGTPVFLHLGWLLPQWRGQGIGTTMLYWSQRRARQKAIELGVQDKAMLATNISTTEHEAKRLIEGAGYRDMHRLSDMKMRLEDYKGDGRNISLPAGVEVRAVEPEHYRAIYAAMNDAWAEVSYIPEPSEAEFQSFLYDNVNTPLYNPDLWQIAWAGDAVVGYVITVIRTNGTATVPEVGVRRKWWRHGIGRALMQLALQTLQKRGVSKVRLYNNAANPFGALTLYQSLGFQEVKQHIFYRKPLKDI